MPGSRRVFRVRVIFLYVARGMVNPGAKVYVIGGGGGGGDLYEILIRKKIITYSSSYSVGAGVSVNLPDNFFMLIKGVRVANPSKFIFFEEKNHEKKTF